MTYKEENIINIAMKAADLLKDGRIELDDMTGHAGLTDTVIALAEQFEKAHAGVDFDAEGRDYWLEIDAFAEAQLLERYACQREHRHAGARDGVTEFANSATVLEDFAGRDRAHSGTGDRNTQGEETFGSPEQVSVLCEEYEDSDAIREFRILAVSSDKDALRKLMEAKIVEDEYGMIEDNGVGDHSQDHFVTEFNCGFVEYYIRDEEVLSREDLERMVNSKVSSKHISEVVKGDKVLYDDYLYTATSDAYMTKTDNGREWNFEVEGDGPESYLYASYFESGIITVASGCSEHSLDGHTMHPQTLEAMVKMAEVGKREIFEENNEKNTDDRER